MANLKRDAVPELSNEVSLALSAFRVGVAAEQRASLAEGVPYPIMDEENNVVWVHPDGTIRPNGLVEKN
jgi:hypothetical protein